MHPEGCIQLLLHAPCSICLELVLREMLEGVWLSFLIT